MKIAKNKLRQDYLDKLAEEILGAVVGRHSELKVKRINDIYEMNEIIDEDTGTLIIIYGYSTLL